MDNLDFMDMHDAVYEATGQHLTKEQLAQVFLLLPDHVQATGREWGLSDTVFRDSVYLGMMRDPLHYAPVVLTKRLHLKELLCDSAGHATDRSKIPDLSSAIDLSGDVTLFCTGVKFMSTSVAIAVIRAACAVSGKVLVKDASASVREVINEVWA